MDAGLDVDGSFGSLTEKAVRNFQSKYGLAVDGIFGKNSKAKMDELLKGSETKPEPTPNKFPYLVRITASSLNVRKGAGTNYGISTVVSKGQVYTIIDEKDGWGKLKSGAGWISLNYTTKL